MKTNFQLCKLHNTRGLSFHVIQMARKPLSDFSILIEREKIAFACLDLARPNGKLLIKYQLLSHCTLGSRDQSGGIDPSGH